MNNYNGRLKLLAKYLRYSRSFSTMFFIKEVPFKKRVRFALIEVSCKLLKFFYLLCRPLLPRLKKKKTDILVLGGAIDLGRNKKLWSVLEQKGYRVTCVQFSIRDLFASFTSKLEADRSIPSVIFPHQLYAKYMLQRFEPGLVCSFDHSGVLPSLLHLSQSAPVVFLPHAVISSSMSYSSFDYTYYLVFGESSVKNVFRSKLRLGSTKLVKTGPTFLNASDYELAPNLKLDSVLYFWVWGKEPFDINILKIVTEWAKQNPQLKLYIKLHPIITDDYPQQFSKGIGNIEILDKKTGMKEALEKVSLVLTSWSNAAIEAAMMSRPVVIVNTLPYNPDSDNMHSSDTYLYMERFFPPRASDALEIHARISEVFANYSFYQQRCREFVHFHYEHVQDAVDYAASVLDGIYKGQDTFQFEVADEKLPTELSMS